MRNYDAVPGISSQLISPKEVHETSKAVVFSVGLDCRVRLLAVAAGTVGVFLLKSEIALGLTALLCFIWLMAFKQVKMGILFLSCYCLLLAIQLLPHQNLAVVSLMMLAGIFRRLIMPAVLAVPLSKASTGALMVALNKFHTPRPVTLALTVMLRFMPTVLVEYRAIRRAQKYRGIGVSWWQLLVHPARTYETILVPLLIRTTRVADELAASAMLRGAADQRFASSFRVVHIDKWDMLVAVAIVLLTASLLIMDGVVGI